MFSSSYRHKNFGSKLLIPTDFDRTDDILYSKLTNFIGTKKTFDTPKRLGKDKQSVDIQLNILENCIRQRQQLKSRQKIYNNNHTTLSKSQKIFSNKSERYTNTYNKQQNQIQVAKQKLQQFQKSKQRSKSVCNVKNQSNKFKQEKSRRNQSLFNNSLTQNNQKDYKMNLFLNQTNYKQSSIHNVQKDISNKKNLPQNKHQLEIKILKQQIQEKNRIIVDLQYQKHQRQNDRLIENYETSQKIISQNKQIQKQKKFKICESSHIKIQPTKNNKNFNVCNKIVLTLQKQQKSMQKYSRETSSTIFETISDLKNHINTQCSQKISQQNASNLKTITQNQYQIDQFSETNKMNFATSFYVPTIKKQSFSQSVELNDQMTISLQMADVQPIQPIKSQLFQVDDLTLSVSQVNQLENKNNNSKIKYGMHLAKLSIESKYSEYEEDQINIQIIPEEKQLDPVWEQKNYQSNQKISQ